MHAANAYYWSTLRDRIPWAFTQCRVAEFGSYSVNGSVREFFTDVLEYQGLDWRPGPGVDVVSLAHEAPFADASFDTVISASLLEHDPYWRESLAAMARVLKRTGVLMLSWGGYGNEAHCNDTAPDGQFHPRPVYEVVDRLTELGLTVVEVRHEEVAGWKGIAIGGVMAVAVWDCAVVAGVEFVFDELPAGDRGPC